jgi:hypothetical protein
MANAYGRGAATSAGRGGNYDAYDWKAKDAKGYLSASENIGYESAIGFMGKDHRLKTNKVHNVERRITETKQAGELASKYRDIAGGRAFGAYAAGATQHSKPWLRTAKEGLLNARTVDNSLAGLDQLGGDMSVGAHNYWATNRTAAHMSPAGLVERERGTRATEEQSRDLLRGETTFRGRGVEESRHFGQQMQALRENRRPEDPNSPTASRQLPWSEFEQNKTGRKKRPETFGQWTPASFDPNNTTGTRTQGYLGGDRNQSIGYKRNDSRNYTSGRV